MKNFRTLVLCASILFYSLSSSAQQTGIPINEPDYNKAKLFQNLPDNIPLSMDIISNLFGSPVGRSVNMNLSERSPFQFEGDVVSSVSKYENTLQSVVIRSTNLNGARLTISRIVDANGNISYTGRILSMQHGDMFELKKINNEYVLVKKNYYDLVNE